MESKIKVFFVDDHDMFREGVKPLLTGGNNIEIVGEAVNGQDFLDKINSLKTDVVLMDIAMPLMDGIEATKKAHQLYPDLKILALTMFGDEKYYYQMITSGVKGFVLKSTSITELIRAITEVANGHSYFSEELLEKLITRFTSFEDNRTKQDPDKLSKREIEVLKLIVEGMTNEEIANELHVSVTTIRTHRAHLMSKTGSSNAASLIMFAIKNKIVEVD